MSCMSTSATSWPVVKLLTGLDMLWLFVFNCASLLTRQQSCCLYIFGHQRKHRHIGPQSPVFLVCSFGLTLPGVNSPAFLMFFLSVSILFPRNVTTLCNTWLASACLSSTSFTFSGLGATDMQQACAQLLPLEFMSHASELPPLPIQPAGASSIALFRTYQI